MAVDYSQLQGGRLNSEQAKNMAELVTTYMTIAPQTNGKYDLTGLANLIQRDGLQAAVDWAKSAGADFRINRGQVKTPYPIAKELVDRLYKDANFSSVSHYQGWLNSAQGLTVDEFLEKWNNAQGQTKQSKLTPEEIETFKTRVQEELPKVIQSDLNNFIQSANKIYQGYDLTPNYGPETDANKLIAERLNQAGYTANQTDLDRWNLVAERYGVGAAIAQMDRALALRNLDKAIPKFAQKEGFEGIKLTGQLPSTYLGASTYQDINYAGTTGNPLLKPPTTQEALVPLSSVPATSVNPLVGTGSTTSSGIPIQGVPTPTLPQTSAPTNIPIQGVPTPQIPSTSSFINTALSGQSNLPSLEAATPVTQGPRPTEQPMPQPMPTPSIFSSLPAPRPLVGTFGSQPLVPQPQIPVQQAPQPQMTNEEFIQQQQAPVEMADGGSVGGASSGVRRLKMSGYQDGGDVSNDEYIRQMMSGTLPEEEGESLVDKKASELLRALAEGTRGFVGAEPIEPGSEAYRTGQALANMPAVGAVAGTIKGAGKVKNLTKKDIKAIAGELETSRGQLAELVKKYPQLLDASIAEVEALTKGEPFTAYRGISLLPGEKLRSEAVPSTTLDPDVALGIIKEAPVMITKEGFITATPVLRQYPGMVASETQAYVPSVISQIRERQPGALEMKIPTRSGEKMTVDDIFKAVEKEKELLADVSKKEPQDILFNRYGGGVGDRYLMEVARKVMTGEWKGGQNLVEEIGGYQTDPKGLAQEFDSFAEMVKSKVMKKADGGEVSTTDFIRKREEGSPPEGEISNDEYIQEMMSGTPPEDMETEPGLLPPELRKGVDVPLDLLNMILRGTAGAVGGPAYGLYKGVTSDKFGTKEGVKEARSEAERMMAEISGEPKTEEVRNLMEKLGQLAEEAKIPPLPQYLTTPAPGPGSASALMRSYELAETPPTGTVKLADKGAKPVATPPTDALGFYSPTEKVVMNLPQEKGTAQQMLAQISKAQGVKPVELRATGLEDYLKGKGNEPVTKQEIQDFLRNNPVQVDEVMLGKGQVISPEAKQRMHAAEDRMMEIDDELFDYFHTLPFVPDNLINRLRGPVARKAVAGDAEAMTELDEMELPPNIKQLALEYGEQKNEYLKYSKQAKRMEKPKFDQYNTPGGENAREIYLTLPGEEQFKVPPAHVVSPEADTNRLAHIFLDDRTDAEGNKTLFVQELQSDWAQQGRDKGFKSPEELATKNAKLADLRAQFDKAIERFEKAEAKFNNRTPSDNDVDLIMGMRRANDEADLLRQEIVKVNTGGLPSAPFVTNTEDWLNLALKRVIKEAVDSGADNVAFIKGEQAAEKYSLSTVLDGIEVFPTKAQSNTSRLIELKQKGGGIIPLFVNEKGVVETAAPRTPKEFIGKSLSEIIGKEMSEKVMAAKRKPGKEESVSFEVEDLVVGGEGMKGFYDNILPKTAEKLLKRLGGGKVEPITMKKRDISGISGYEAMDRIGIPEDQQEMHWINLTQEERENLIERARNTSPTYLGFKITPEMREMVQKEGLPKFAAGGEVTDFIKRVA